MVWSGAVEAADVTSERSLEAWLRDVITHGAGRTDAIVLRHAHRTAGNLAALTDIANLAYATAACRERQK